MLNSAGRFNQKPCLEQARGEEHLAPQINADKTKSKIANLSGVHRRLACFAARRDDVPPYPRLSAPGVLLFSLG